MTSSDDPANRDGASGGPGLGKVALLLLLAAMVGGGFLVVRQQRQRSVERAIVERERAAREMYEESLVQAQATPPQAEDQGGPAADRDAAASGDAPETSEAPGAEDDLLGLPTGEPGAVPSPAADAP